MVEQTRRSDSRPAQQVLDVGMAATDHDPDYGHLVAHLLDQETAGNDLNYWTGVLSRDDLGALQPAIFKLGADLIYDKAMRDSLTTLDVARGQVLFSPFIFKRDDLQRDLAGSRLEQQELMGLGQVATAVRQRFMTPITVPDREWAERDDGRVIKLKRGYTRGDRGQVQFRGAFDELEFREGPRRKTKRRHELSSEEVARVINAVKVDKLGHREVATKYGVSAKLVSELVVADRKDATFQHQVREREGKRGRKLQLVLAHALDKLRDNTTVFKAADVQAAVLEQHGVKVSLTYVCSVMRHDIGAKYARVKRVPFLGNSGRCLLLRQHYAKFMLAQLASGVRCINLDQTWLNTSNFTRCKWRLRGQTGSLPTNSVAPRISVQMAVCTEGRLYASLSQANTDAKTFCLFISKLCAKLTKESPDWRDNTVLLIDGARYQTCAESVGHMKALGFRVVISAPYSYSTAPIELAFAFLKQGNLNPGQLKTGKR